MERKARIAEDRVVSIGRFRWVWALGVALCAVASLVVARVALHSRQTSARLEQLEAQLARDKEQGPESRVIIREVRTEPRAVEETAAPNTVQPESKASAQAPEISAEEREHRLLAINQARIESCAAKLAQETVDPNWSAGAARTIRERLSGDEFKELDIAAVDCRASLCRVEFSYANSATGMTAVRNLAAMSPWSGGRFSHVNQETHQGQTYIAREGFDIPEGDEQASM
jgi:hypothetical protein